MVVQVLTFTERTEYTFELPSISALGQVRLSFMDHPKLIKAWSGIEVLSLSLWQGTHFYSYRRATAVWNRPYPH
ncbi:hypothetical protein FRX31_013844 [Thalictrum thalictroides]|uniref:Uncharacterized protein n=1 Tax=Thalictrum thalictroides TaxID=46969 RepID=A0A7J6WGW0_THATH|nr:hypothetical protein FRX31_013844 [Thalictrum thalictroides]